MTASAALAFRVDFEATTGVIRSLRVDQNSTITIVLACVAPRRVACAGQIGRVYRTEHLGKGRPDLAVVDRFRQPRQRIVLELGPEKRGLS